MISTKKKYLIGNYFEDKCLLNQIENSSSEGILKMITQLRIEANENSKVENLTNQLQPVIKFFNTEIKDKPKVRLTAKQKEELELKEDLNRLNQKSLSRLKEKGLLS